MGTLELIVSTTLFYLFVAASAVESTAAEPNVWRQSSEDTLCQKLIDPAGYPCTEHPIQTKDGYLPALHRVSSRNRNLRGKKGPPVLLQHGLLMGGDVWFLGSPERSLGFMLADQGFDVWVGNVRGTFWSYGHVSLSKEDKEFWDWSWQELALYDLAEMTHHIYSTTNSKIFIVGHSQGTIMSLAALTQPNIAERIEAAALLCPISYLKHISAPLALKMVYTHLDETILALGIHEVNFKSNEVLINLLDSLCKGYLECKDLLTSITGKNCCFNNSNLDSFFEYEPQPSSTKNVQHLFQMIREGTFSQFDYGWLKNLLVYGQVNPPVFDLSLVPKSLPLWMGYGGNDGLADLTDIEHTLTELQSTPVLHYVENYGHLDFLLSTQAKEDVYDHLIGFFRSKETTNA